MRDIGLLQQHPHASATYYTPTQRLLQPGEEVASTVEQEDFVQVTLPTSGAIDTDKGKAFSEIQAPKDDPLPTMLKDAIQNLGKRSPPWKSSGGYFPSLRYQVIHC